jgi:hypothetical protein
MPSIATGISLRLPSCLFPSSPHLCLQWASSLRLTRQSDGFEAPSRKDGIQVHRRWSPTSIPRSITALSTMCTPLHPSPFYRNLTLPVRGRHILPNPATNGTFMWFVTSRVPLSTPPHTSNNQAFSMTSPRRPPKGPLPRSCQPRQPRARWRRRPTRFVCITASCWLACSLTSCREYDIRVWSPQECIHPSRARGTLFVSTLL